MIRKTGDTDFPRSQLYDIIYDVLCKGNDIDGMIAQSQFNSSLSFNPYKYFVKELKYDAIEQMKNNDILRENVISIDCNMVDCKDLIGIFADMERKVFLINGKVLAKIRELETRQNFSKKSIL